MIIENNKVVSFHYTLTSGGQKIESSVEREPMSYLHGAKNIIPGLEIALTGKSQGDAFTVEVTPEQGYGAHNPNLAARLPNKHLKPVGQLRTGGMAIVETQQGPQQVRLLKVGRFHSDVDANHPLAGHTLNFEVEVMSIRDASDEEIEHGHAHGPGGHHHEEE